ncbi:zinc finger protein MSN4-like [Myzus persicae]|uniref:zinc finger protein MSN4-like n=1 Tax=Myzus persicae TaxID=13164 RepID=UPI000B93554E|nr:zinc finger protein MSN4-like [Myzus persicae]
MSKNPFVCKTRRRKKAKTTPTPIVKPKEKAFCPRSMVRYEGSPNDYSTKWVCKMCLKCLLSEAAVLNHVASCTSSSRPQLPAVLTNNNEDTRYICEFCNKIFSRRVTLKKHLEEHEKSSSSLGSEQSDNEVEDDPSMADDDDKPEEPIPCSSKDLI